MSAIAASDPSRERVESSRPRDLSIDLLRATLTLMVLAHHSCLAYTSWARFDAQHIFRSTAPVVDSMRWAFFDYAENFNDVFFMSLLFFISGLFVYPALRKHGAIHFARDRALRLGVPFAFAVVFLMPVAYYASWQLTGRSHGFWDFYTRLAKSGLAVGPPWFLWVLLFFDLVIAAVAALASALLPRLATSLLPRLASALKRLDNRPAAAFSGFFVLAALAYLPMLARYGFGTWAVLITSPFAFQVARIGLYFVWFLFGLLVGTPGLSVGLLSRHAALARRWPVWMLGCVVAYNALWFTPKSALVQHALGARLGAVEAVLWVLSCVASSFGFLAIFRGIALHPRPFMLSLSRSAYGMYLVHYVYVTWLQRLLLDRPIAAGFKFLFVFLGTTILSWVTVQAALRLPGVRAIL